MHGKTSALLVTGILLAGSSLLAIAGDDKNGDKKALQGTWSFTKENDKIKLTFSGDKFTMEFKGKSASGTFKIDPTQKPRTIDLTITKGSDDETRKYEGKTSLGIYQIDGNKLKWMASEPGREERPKAFPADGEKVKMLYVTFEREKK